MLCSVVLHPYIQVASVSASPAHTPLGTELIFQSMSHRILVSSDQVFEDAVEIAFM